jgi:hypothetical protein
MSGTPRRKRRYRPLRATIAVTGMPELLALVQREMADVLREAAADEPPALARRLREIADLFETGLREEP